MAKAAKKKKRKLVLPNKRLLVIAGVVLVAALVYGGVWLQHNHAVMEDKNRFARAGNDVETVADAVVVAVGQPADRKDNGKCNYPDQTNKGSLSCQIYSYLAYSVDSPDQVNQLVTKAGAVNKLNTTPWRFLAITERPHQFSNGVSYSDDFVGLKDLFDIEIKTVAYKNEMTNFNCTVTDIYHDSISSVPHYPNFKNSTPQELIIAISCASPAKAAYFSIQ